MQCTSNLCLWCRTSVRRTVRSELLRFHSSVISLCLELTLQENSFLTRFTPTLSHSCCIWTIMKTQFGRWYNCTRSIDNNNSYILCDSYWQPNRNVGWQLCSRTMDQQINWWMYLDILLHIQSRVMKLSLESCSCSFMIFWKGIYTGTVIDLEVIWSQVSDTKIKLPLKNLVHCRYSVIIMLQHWFTKMASPCAAIVHVLSKCISHCSELPISRHQYAGNYKYGRIKLSHKFVNFWIQKLSLYRCRTVPCYIWNYTFTMIIRVKIPKENTFLKLISQ